MSKFALVRKLESLRRSHYVCEDCWYSCPASGECCRDYDETRTECDCGADEHNAQVDEAISLLEDLRDGP